MKRISFVLAIWLAFWAVTPGYATDPVVRAVLFYSPTCPHCHKVMTEDLPPLQAQYGDRLWIAQVDVREPEGQELYQAAIVRFSIPPERQGVPALVVKDQVLVGSEEIPQRFPKLIAEGLAAGGIDWPDIPGFKPPARPERSSVPQLSLRERLAHDPAGNALAIVVLLGIVAFTSWVGVQAWRERRAPQQPMTGAGWRVWAVPVLSVAGLAVAAYLSYVEIAQTSAVCGPVGNCNAVQQSVYARLWGIPIGVLGMVNYVAILAAWAVGRWRRDRTAAWGQLALFVFTGLGTLFSIYLTFLEPFVIGASCAWCLTSAVIMTALLGLSWQPGVAAWPSVRPAPRRRPRRRRAHAR